MATFQPLLRPPTTFSFGHRAPSKNTSLNSPEPSGWMMGRTSMPSCFMGTSRYEIPACFGALGSVRASRKM